MFLATHGTFSRLGKDDEAILLHQHAIKGHLVLRGGFFL